VASLLALVFCAAADPFSKVVNGEGQGQGALSVTNRFTDHWSFTDNRSEVLTRLPPIQKRT